MVSTPFSWSGVAFMAVATTVAIIPGCSGFKNILIKLNKYLSDCMVLYESALLEGFEFEFGLVRIVLPPIPCAPLRCVTLCSLG